MRKKIIKSYFFKPIKNTTALNSTFSFSKRAVKQRKMMDRAIRLRYKLNADSIANQHKYKYLIKVFINYNFWFLNRKQTPLRFLKSYFCTRTIFHGFRKSTKMSLKYLYLWYTFKRQYYKNLSKQLRHFPNTGVLSSHFVHLISKKNFTYQNWSKYRAKQFNTQAVQNYLRVYTHILYNYIMTINTKTYFFTKAFDKKAIDIVPDFNTTVSNWENVSFKHANNYKFLCRLSKYSGVKILINRYDFNFTLLREVTKNLDKFQRFFDEVDTSKKEELHKEISNVVSTETISIAYLVASNLFSTLDKHTVHQYPYLYVTNYYIIYMLCD